ncbi:hypothetical protein SynA1825c_00911 [Synechococcus sp. A18-25c]|nr:hypothetical protein SynA1825c_00911 [Synechococcus sp. A18-25c]
MFPAAAGHERVAAEGHLPIKQPTNDKQLLARHKEWKYLGEQFMTPRLFPLCKACCLDTRLGCNSKRKLSYLYRWPL